MTDARIVEDIMRALFGSDTDTLADQDNCVSLSSLIGDQYNFVRIGGLGGASEILMALYVSSQLQDVHDVRERLQAHIMASRVHFVHSFAMLCMPMVHYPEITGGVMIVGTILYSGSKYYRALTDDNRFEDCATIGVFCLIFGWLSLVF